MRVTNSMINNNSLTNINSNKTLLDIMNTQMATQKKISRPSENPVIAVRALRLRSNLNDITQFYERNIPDAASWMELTESALTQVEGVITSITTLCNDAINMDMSAEDRKKSLETLKGLRDQIFAEANADSAGRYIFSGYKTDTKMTFTSQDLDASFRITEKFSASDIEKYAYISDKLTIDKNNPATVPSADGPKQNEVYRIRLGYNELTAIAGSSIQYKSLSSASAEQTYNAATRTAETTLKASDDTEISKITTVNNSDGSKSVTVGTQKFEIDKNGRVTPDAANDGSVNIRMNNSGNIVSEIKAGGEQYNIETSIKGNVLGSITETKKIAVTESSYAENGDAAYKVADGAVHFIPETGELILGKDAVAALQNLPSVNGEEAISFTYNKTGFEKNDLYPQNFYDCTDLQTNVSYIKEKEAIEYEVSFNQKLKINTEGNTVYDQNMTRDIDELMNIINETLAAEEKVATIEAMQKDENYTQEELDAIDTMLEAAERERDFAIDKLTNAFSKTLGNFQKYGRIVSDEIADLGSREVRLGVVETRVKEQQTNFKSLQSKNEDKELSDIIIEFTAAQNAYNASLTAASKVTQNTLLNFL